MKQTIVSNRNLKPTKPKPKKLRNLMFFSIGLFLTFSIIALVLKLPLLFFLPFAALVIYFRSLWSESRDHFHAYINGGLLCIDFKDTGEATGAHYRKLNYRNCHLELLLHSIRGYKLHSFLGKAPELMQIQILVQNKLIETRPIPIYYLNKEQQQTFLLFLDTLIVKTKRLQTG